MKTLKFIFMMSAVIMLASCDSKKEKYDPYAISGENNKPVVSKSSFEVPYKKTESNLMTVHVNLNGKNSYDAIFDTGCSGGVSISTLEALDFDKSGTLDDVELISTATSTLADGSEREVVVYELKSLTITDKNGQEHTLTNVPVIIEENLNADIIIGASVINNLAKNSYTVDLKKQVIRFE